MPHMSECSMIPEASGYSTNRTNFAGYPWLAASPETAIRCQIDFLSHSNIALLFWRIECERKTVSWALELHVKLVASNEGA